MIDDTKRYEATTETVIHLLSDLGERLAVHPEGITDTLSRDKSLGRVSAMKLSGDAAKRLEEIAKALAAAKMHTGKALAEVQSAQQMLYRAESATRKRASESEQA